MLTAPTLLQPKKGHLCGDSALDRIGEYLSVNFDILYGQKHPGLAKEPMVYGSDISQMISDIEDGLCGCLDPMSVEASEADVMRANIGYVRSHFQGDAPGIDTLIAIKQLYRVYQLAHEAANETKADRRECFRKALRDYANEQKVSQPLRKDFYIPARV
jgi:hypothetical protein